VGVYKCVKSKNSNGKNRFLQQTNLILDVVPEF
jgi:hypothetical protein